MYFSCLGNVAAECRREAPDMLRRFLKLLTTFRPPEDELMLTECSLDKPCTGISVNLISTLDPQE